MVSGALSGRAAVNRILPEQHARALSCGGDVPEEAPGIAIPLSAVGISGKTVWIRLPEGRIPFDASLSVRLPSSRRGIHMSRMEEAISELDGCAFPGPAEYAQRLLELMLSNQYSSSGTVTLHGQLPYLSATGVSQRRSVDSLRIDVEVARDFPGPCRVLLGVGIYHITACPCTQVYLEAAGNTQKTYPDRPMITHSQRAITLLRVERDDAVPTVAALRRCLESALHVSQDLLKRGDEAELVLKAHTAPQFAEDAVREVAQAAFRFFGHCLPPDCRVQIESTSFESIHIHDVNCRLDSTIGELRSILG